SPAAVILRCSTPAYVLKSGLVVFHRRHACTGFGLSPSAPTAASPSPLQSAADRGAAGWGRCLVPLRVRWLSPPRPGAGCHDGAIGTGRARLVSTLKRGRRR